MFFITLEMRKYNLHSSTHCTDVAVHGGRQKGTWGAGERRGDKRPVSSPPAGIYVWTNSVGDDAGEEEGGKGRRLAGRSTCNTLSGEQ